MIFVTSRENPAVRRIAALMSKKKVRRDAGLFVCEGEKVFREAVEARVGITDVLLTEDCLSHIQADVAACEAAGAHIFIVTPQILAAVSDVETPQGVIFTAPIREGAAESRPADLLICEELRDPGNLGTIIRTADAFGCGGVYLCGDCVDVYSPKVVRSCMGSIFRVPIYRGNYTECAEFCSMHELRLLVAKPRMDSFAISEGLPCSCAVAIGNEAHGISAELDALAQGSLYVDMSGGAESLNAAVCAGVVLWHMQTARCQK